MIFDDEQGSKNMLAYVYLFAFYFVNYFVNIFFNTALMTSAISRLKGGNPTLKDGLTIAINRLSQITG